METEHDRMSEATLSHEPKIAKPASRGHHPGIALAVIASLQLMVVLDATIVNIALPQIQDDLGFSPTDLVWVLSAYTLTFGGFLLLGGRAGDILGRRRVFMFGIALFSVASLLGGFAPDAGSLLAARALQGIGGAIASPTALSLITTNFREGAERNKAFGVFAAVSGAGAAIGLILGGLLTEWLNWRWVLFVNVPIGIALYVLSPLFINESEKNPGKFDVVGAITSTAGMSALVYGFIRAADQSKGWDDTWTIASFVAAVVLLAVFVVVEARHPQPIVPLRMVSNRDRSSSYIVMLSLAAGMFGMFFFLTLFVQRVLDYGPIKAGFAFLPVSVAIVITAQIASRQVLTRGPKPFMIAGSILAVVGLAWMTLLDAESTYVGDLLGPMVVFASGMGFLFVPLTIIAVSGVAPEDSGAASGMLNVMQQVGGSLGLAILTTAFGTASANHLTSLQTSGQAASLDQEGMASELLAHGAAVAFQAAVAFAIVALVVSVVGIRAKASDLDGSAMPGMGA
jgi:EmrB/QacA subfamily drug resistance transporter